MSESLSPKLLTPAFNAVVARTLVEACGGRYGEDEYGPQDRVVADTDAAFTALTEGAVCLLPDHGVIRATGDDAMAFLHGQFTNDIEHLPAQRTQWNGYCSAKGRLLATALNWRDNAGVSLMVSRPLATAMRKRLSMFVLRAKVKLDDLSDSMACLGIMGQHAAQTLRGLGLELPQSGSAVEHDGVILLGLPASVPSLAPPRVLMIVSADRAADLLRRLSTTLCRVSSNLWRLAEVRDGIARISPNTSERFVPQMVNFELIGGVSFKKGCYPGQEVVARSHYLGKLKRRMFAGYSVSSEVRAGDDVFASGQSEPVGQVVLAAPSPEGGYELLYEAQIAHARDGVLAGGVPIAPRELPYALPA